ncbi:MAG: hypothetical protein M0R50_03340 [Candidatus Cloacimonetes bacterium]|jgi:predicted RNA-binding Zn-ribbon protein involved in translation (DUF1610 family)|nr:hypothetical protein [Candidatus Cloacimonadota bacterium]
MKLSELRKYFTSPEDDVDLNPLMVAENKAFNRPSSFRPDDDYREQALNMVTKHKLPFNATDNSVWNIFKRLVKVTCPYCGGETKCMSGGGVVGYYSVYYQCESCGGSIQISIEPGGFSADPGNRVGEDRQ